jgi:dephospho-CoA kinase
MRVIGLTGTVAAGKSTVARLFAGWGATVIDADAIVRELQQPGEPVHGAIVARFGTDVVQPDGTLDRAALRRIVLSDAVARADLERLVHPAVELRRRELLADARRRGAQVVIADIPLLFESTDPAAYDGIIVVDAPREERMRRLVTGRGLSAADAEALMAAQWPAARKRAHATWIIDNDGTRADLEQLARAVWSGLVS